MNHSIGVLPVAYNIARGIVNGVGSKMMMKPSEERKVNGPIDIWLEAMSHGEIGE